MNISESYYKKYLEYKNRYVVLKAGSKKDALVMLCMINEAYVVGACISAYIHRLFLRKNNIDSKISIVIMVDDTIYNSHKTLLLRYFDKVILIPLIKIQYEEGYKPLLRYSKWLEFSLSKLYCLNLTEYSKILFIDIGILPISSEFYNLFELTPPGFVYFDPLAHVKKDMSYLYDCKHGSKHKIENISSFMEYVKISTNKFVSPSLFLLEPNESDYTDLIKMINQWYQFGIYSNNTFGPDAATLTYFFLYHKNMVFSQICFEYLGHLSRPAYNTPEFRKKTKSYVFQMSPIKPWMKPIFLLWNDELIWKYIYYNMPNDADLISLNNKIVAIEYNNFITRYDEIKNKSKKEIATKLFNYGYFLNVLFKNKNTMNNLDDNLQKDRLDNIDFDKFKELKLFLHK